MFLQKTVIQYNPVSKLIISHAQFVYLDIYLNEKSVLIKRMIVNDIKNLDDVFMKLKSEDEKRNGYSRR